jgi:hypothetical protein
MSGRFSQNDLVVVTRENEVTPGVVVGGSRYRVYGTAPSWTPGGNSNTSGINTGDGGEHSHRAALRFGDAEVPSQLVFGLNDFEFEDQLRDTWQADELTISGSFTFNQGGTHVDGSTGPVITATAGTFDDLFATAEFAGLMMEISGVAINAANKWPRAVKDVKPDGSQIDIEPVYASALAGAFREQLVAESDKAGVMRFGKWLRNQGVENIRSCNFEFSNTDQPGGSFALVKGCHGSGMKLSLTGKGNVELQFMYVGMDYDDLGTVSVGSGVTANPFISNEVISSAEDLAYFAINGTTLLSGDNLTSFTLDGNGNASGIDDVAGSRSRPGVTVGDLVFSGSLKVYHKHALSAVLVALGRNGNKVPVDFKLQDPAGNFFWGRYPSAMFEPNAPKPGAKGSKTDNTINYKTQLGKRSQRTFILQRFAAAA